jgi:hypothetical protein
VSAAKGAEIVKRSDTRNEEIRTALDGRKCWKALYFPSDGTLWNCGVVGAILGADEGLESVPDGGFGARLEVARCTHRLAMGEMAASIAHEINQPLAAIASNGYAGLRWLANPTPKLDEARDALERIVNDSQRAKEVVAGIRSMFKREGQAKEPQESTSSFVRSSPLFAVTRKINACRFAPSYSTNSRKFRLARFSCAR